MAPADVCVIPEDKLDHAMEEALGGEADESGEAAEPDGPGEALAFRNLSLQDENGRIPAEGLIQAKAQLDAMMASEPRGAAGAGILSGS